MTETICPQLQHSLVLPLIQILTPASCVRFHDAKPVVFLSTMMLGAQCMATKHIGYNSIECMLQTTLAIRQARQCSSRNTKALHTALNTCCNERTAVARAAASSTVALVRCFNLHLSTTRVACCNRWLVLACKGPLSAKCYTVCLCNRCLQLSGCRLILEVPE